MINSSWRPLLVALFVVIAFLGIHSLLQDERIHTNTLGRISQNYERIGTWDNSEVIRNDKPFMPISSDSLRNWDAGIYACIKERMYTVEPDCYGRVRAAFFPLMPLVWRISGTDAIGMALLNYAFFVAGLVLLILLLHERLEIFSVGVLLTFPSAIIFGIPYSESLFTLTMAIVAWGMLKERYAVYFVGALLLAMVRPATLFVLIAVLMSEVLVNMRQGPRSTVKAVVRRAAPFVVGYGMVLLIQYVYAGSWRAMLDAQAYWHGEVRTVTGIKDWSQESFGLSSFAVFFVCVPAMLFAFARLWRSVVKTDTPGTDQGGPQLLGIGCFYLAGILLFTALTSGGDLHSFHRFTLASPFFYIVALIVLKRSDATGPMRVLIPMLTAALLLVLFLVNTEYGGERAQFAYAGMYLSIAGLSYLLFQQHLNVVLRGVAGAVLILANIVWAAYLLNCFVVDGWFFT